MNRVVQVEDSGETRQKDLTYENGNVVKVIARGPTYQQTLTYEYDLGRLSIPTVGYDLVNELSPDGGQDDQYSRNLVLKKTDARINQITGSLTTQVLNTYRYTYTFDAQNRVNRRLLIQTKVSRSVRTLAWLISRIRVPSGTGSNDKTC